MHFVTGTIMTRIVYGLWECLTQGLWECLTQGLCECPHTWVV